MLAVSQAEKKITEGVDREGGFSLLVDFGFSASLTWQF